MSENDKNDKKRPLTLSTKLELKPATPGSARPAAPGKTVIVQVKKSKTGVAGDGASKTVSTSRMRGMQLSQAPKPAPKAPAEAPQKSQLSIDAASHLTNKEREARINALKGALSKADDNQKKEIERLEREHQAALESAERRRVDEEARIRDAEIQAEAQIPEVVAPAFPVEDAAAKPIQRSFKPVVPPVAVVMEEDDGRGKKKHPGSRKVEAPRVAGRGDAPGRRTGRLSVQRVLGAPEGDSVRTRSLASIRRAKEKERKKLGLDDEQQAKIVRTVVVPETITVQDLANRMAEKSSDVIKCLMRMGVMATITQVIDGDTAQLVVEEIGHLVKRVSDEDLEQELLQTVLRAGEVVEVPRPPVVTVMGHVDHGKTSLLDALRKTDVVSGESGGITQHIGAYQVHLSEQKAITFIDTPGHAAFTQMRARGANITDIVVLVVAADDGIKEQTVEAINHAKAAGVPIVVAINKIDKPEADPTRVRSELLQHGIVLEEFGGDVLAVEVSAKQSLNLLKLEEVILLQAEVLDLKAPIDGPAMGTVLEARLDKGRGAVATILVQKGTLRVGDIFVAGTQCGRVRAMVSDSGKKLEFATPAMPVEIVGFDAAPQAGDCLIAVGEEQKAREIALFRDQKRKGRIAALQEKTKKDNLFSDVEGLIKEVSVIIKSDAQGSCEAIAASLLNLATDEIKVRVIHTGVGGINESDVVLASASNALVIGFHVRANNLATSLATKEGISIAYYSIIYDIIDDIRAKMTGLLSPILQEKFLGRATIRQIFRISNVGTIAGCYVTAGIVKRGAKVRLLRDDVVIYEGPLKTLKRMKDEVKEVKEGYECGMGFESYNDLREGDVIECSEIQEIARTL